jgi:hypothetical protein
MANTYNHFVKVINAIDFIEFTGENLVFICKFAVVLTDNDLWEKQRCVKDYFSLCNNGPLVIVLD